MLADSEFWVALLQIIWIDIVLSGDNAVVIALACRSLPPRQRRWGIALGAAGAIALRVLIATFIVYVLEVPALKIVGGVLLFWIAIKLLLPEPGDATRAVGGGGGGLFAAMRTVMIADAVMSLDNVIGIA
ncbi:MAG: YjbE family putative metal transport protein, partial [Dongiaceae bacterium]